MNTIKKVLLLMIHLQFISQSIENNEFIATKENILDEMSFSVVTKLDESRVYINISAPSNTWLFGVGFGSSSMMNTYAIIASIDDESQPSVKEYILGAYSIGYSLPTQQIVLESDRTSSNIRSISVSRPITGDTYDFPSNIQTYSEHIHVIAAYINDGKTYHGQKRTSTTIQLKSITKMASQFPTKMPSQFPSQFPSKFPSQFPSKFPSQFPTKTPSQFPSQFPTKIPSKFPFQFPTKMPSKFPTTMPSKFPTAVPSKSPIKPPAIMVEPKVREYITDGFSWEVRAEAKVACYGQYQTDLATVLTLQDEETAVITMMEWGWDVGDVAWIGTNYMSKADCVALGIIDIDHLYVYYVWLELDCNSIAPFLCNKPSGAISPATADFFDLDENEYEMSLLQTITISVITTLCILSLVYCATQILFRNKVLKYQRVSIADETA